MWLRVSECQTQAAFAVNKRSWSVRDLNQLNGSDSWIFTKKTPSLLFLASFCHYKAAIYMWNKGALDCRKSIRKKPTIPETDLAGEEVV